MPDVLIPIPIETVTDSEEQPSLTYRLDLDAGRIVGKVNNLEAVNQAIRKAIITPRFKCLIYDNQYGSEIEDAIIRNDASRDYIETAIEGFVKDALVPDSRILNLYNFAVEFKNDAAYISFSADTIFGTTTIEEVL